MFGRLRDLPEISSSGEMRDVEGIKLELEGPLEDVPYLPSWPERITEIGDVVFVGRLSNTIVVCVGKVLKYEVVREDFAKLDMVGRVVSFSVGDVL